ncbi:MAG: hypothetical protein GKC53_05915 [Neisseriaceae bacterium]|nr:MAG: hypothetical protein GKC53_05915 [Neisseriaceae bacterium]
MKNFIVSFIFKINKTWIVPVILLTNISFSCFMLWYFSYQKKFIFRETIDFYTYNNVLVEMLLAFLIGRYFQIEEDSDSYNKLLQIPNRSKWFFSITLCFLFIFILSVLSSYLIFFIFNGIISYTTSITLLILTILFNIIYIPCFSYVAIRFNSAISIFLSFILLSFILCYGLNTPVGEIRQYIPFLYSFLGLKIYLENNYSELLILVGFYTLFVGVIFYVISKWYSNWDGK